MRPLAAIIAGFLLLALLNSAIFAQTGPSQGWLGVSFRDVREEEVKALGIEKPNGPKIVRLDAISEDVSNDRDFTDRISPLPLRSGNSREQEPKITTQAELMPDQRPILRIEPGMHTAPIVRIGVDATCTLMATGSVDKTARLWAWRCLSCA